MGSRMYLIKEVERNRFKAVYSHWGNGELFNTALQGISKDELYNKLLDMWNEEYEKESQADEPLIYDLDLNQLYEFINFDDIIIEAYAIIWLDKRITIFLTIISNFINGSIRFDTINNRVSPYSLYWAYEELGKAKAIVNFLEVLKYDKDKAIELLRKGWFLMKKQGSIIYDLVIGKNLKEAVEKYYTLPLKSINGIIWY